MSTNSDLADQLRGIADLLDLLGERFKPEAYRRAARTIESLPEDIRAIAARGGVDELPGVGQAISEKIREFLSTGSIPYFDRTRATVPPGVVELMRLSGMGPKTARRFWMELGVEGPAELSAAIEAGKLDGLSGFGPKKISNLKAALAAATSTGRRLPLPEAYELAERLLARLRPTPVDQLVLAGSFRRRRESVGDLDILATSREPEKVLGAFVQVPECREVKMHGPTKVTIVVEGGVQVDLRVVEPAAFGAAWQYFTGSKDHNVELRSMAKDRGLKINEYGVYRGEERIAGATEEEVYAAFQLAWIPPEIREGRGEITAAGSRKLPPLVQATDLKGDLHVHLDRPTPAAVATAVRTAEERGWSYLGLVAPLGHLDELRRSVGSARPKARTWCGVEVEPDQKVAPDEGAEFVIVRAGEAPPASVATGPDRVPRVVAHLRTGELGALSDPALAAPWIALASKPGWALEITARGAADGLDASQAAAAVAKGVPLHLARGLGTPSEEALSLGVARRAGVGPASVLNARAEPVQSVR